MNKLPLSFYLRQDVAAISRDLLGKLLMTRIDGLLTGGIITETEAYAGPEDRASHAYGNRRTQRTDIMFRNGGIAYIYLCYGVHHLFNVVTNVEDRPHAVLIRAIHPVIGIPAILNRRGFSQLKKGICGGPGMLTQGLGILTKYSGESLRENTIWIEDSGMKISGHQITVGKRVGVEYSGADAHRLWRFRVLKMETIREAQPGPR